MALYLMSEGPRGREGPLTSVKAKISCSRFGGLRVQMGVCMTHGV
jgi:hypothetical protein